MEYNKVNYDVCWKTKDGRVIPYREMSTTHLENTYNMLAGMLCDFQNRTYNMEDFCEIPDYVETAMDAIAVELDRRELYISEKIKKGDNYENQKNIFIP